MTPKRRFIFWLLSVMVATIFGVAVGRVTAPKPPATDDPEELVARLDQWNIKRSEMEIMYPYLQGRALGELIEQRLIRIAAAQKKIKDSDIHVVFPRFLRHESDYHAWGRALDRDALLEKLALSDWPESRLRLAYEAFGEECSQYEIAFFRLARPQELEAVQEDMARDVDFESLVARYAPDEGGKKGLGQGWYFRSELEEIFGASIASELSRLSKGGTSKPQKVGSEVYIFKVKQARETFGELKPYLQGCAVTAGTPVVLYELLANAKISVAGILGGSTKIVDYRL